MLAAADVENATPGGGKTQTEKAERQSTRKSSRGVQQTKAGSRNGARTVSERSSMSEKSTAASNRTVLTPPLALSSQRLASPCGRTSPSSRAQFAEPTATTANVSDVQKMADKPGSGSLCEIPGDKEHALSVASGSNKSTPAAAVVLQEPRCNPDELTAADNIVDRSPESHASVIAMGVNMSDSSLHLDTQMLRAIVGPTDADVVVRPAAAVPAGDHAESVPDINGHPLYAVPAPASGDNPISAIPVPTFGAAPVPTNSDRPVSEAVLDTSAELEGLGPSSATCQFMKEFSTPKSTAQADIFAAVPRDANPAERCPPNTSVTLRTLGGCLQPTDLSVSSELVAASNFDRATGDNHAVADVAYSEEILFYDGGDPVETPLTNSHLSAVKQNSRLSAHFNDGIVSDEAPAVDDCAENRSDLFASYIEDPVAEVRAPLCPGRVPAETSFRLAYDSLTSTMFDRAMAAAANPVDDLVEPVQSHVAGNRSKSRQVGAPPGGDLDTALDLHANFDLDAEAAVNLLCDGDCKSEKKPPKRRGRKRNSGSIDPFRQRSSGTGDVAEKRQRSSNPLPAADASLNNAVVGRASLSPSCDSAKRPRPSNPLSKPDVNLNDAVCSRTSLSVSFGSATDSSAYVPPTPPSTATEKSSGNTPRRLPGGVSGVTPVKSEHSVHRARKNISQSGGAERAPKSKSPHSSRSKTRADVELVVNKPGIIAEVAPCEHDGVVTDPSLSSQCFTVIDVAADCRLFDTFVSEWRQQQRFSLSLACEKRSKSPCPGEGIGAKFTRGILDFIFLSSLSPLVSQSSISLCNKAVFPSLFCLVTKNRTPTLGRYSPVTQ